MSQFLFLFTDEGMIGVLRQSPVCVNPLNYLWESVGNFSMLSLYNFTITYTTCPFCGLFEQCKSKQAEKRVLLILYIYEVEHKTLDRISSQQYLRLSHNSFALSASDNWNFCSLMQFEDVYSGYQLSFGNKTILSAVNCIKHIWNRIQHWWIFPCTNNGWMTSYMKILY